MIEMKWEPNENTSLMKNTFSSRWKDHLSRGVDVSVRSVAMIQILFDHANSGSLLRGRSFRACDKGSPEDRDCCWAQQFRKKPGDRQNGLTCTKHLHLRQGPAHTRKNNLIFQPIHKLCWPFMSVGRVCLEKNTTQLRVTKQPPKISVYLQGKPLKALRRFLELFHF